MYIGKGADTTEKQLRARAITDLTRSPVNKNYDYSNAN